jgi:lupus La protein
MIRGYLLQYYFGDINLPRDKYLQEQIKLEDGWVPLEVMLKFKRLSSLTTDCDVVVTALEASKLMEVRTRFIL